jgi:type IV secretion system protein VirD4
MTVSSSVMGKLKGTVLGLIGCLIAFAALYSFGSGDNDGYVLAVLLVALFVFIKIRWKIKVEDTDDFIVTEEGARWCSSEEFEETNNPEGNFENGVWIGGRFTRSKFFNAVVIGGAGAGKTTGHLIPNLLLKPNGSNVIIDIKGEIAFSTARAQLEYSQRVFILDFWGVQDTLRARHGIKSSGFNPFDFIKHDPENLIDNCHSIAYFLCPDKPGDKDGYWTERSRAMIKNALLHIITGMPESDHNFWTLYKVLRLSGEDWINHLLDMKKNKAMDGLISIAAEEWLGMADAETTLQSIRSNAQAATAIFESPALRNFMQRSEFNPYDLTNGDCTVYVVIPERFLDTHSTVLRLIIGLCLKACNARPNNPVYYFLDEVPMLKRMADIQKNFAFGRGQNIHMLLYAQSVSALKEIYGDAWEGFIANAAIVQCYGGARDQMTRSYFSSLLGEKVIIKKSRSFGSSESKDGRSSSTSTSYSTEKQPLLTPEQIGNVDGIITIADGKKFVIGNLPYFKNKYDGVDPNAEWLDEEEKALLKKGITPTDETYELFMKKADQPVRY